jgi:hypothetical protein
MTTTTPMHYATMFWMKSIKYYTWVWGNKMALGQICANDAMVGKRHYIVEHLLLIGQID